MKFIFLILGIMLLAALGLFGSTCQDMVLDPIKDAKHKLEN